jgi:hypothetical protein
MLASNIPTPSLLDPRDTPTPQRKFLSHNYSIGGGSGIVGGGSSEHLGGKGNVREEEAEEGNDGFSSSGSGKR